VISRSLACKRRWNDLFESSLTNHTSHRYGIEETYRINTLWSVIACVVLCHIKHSIDGNYQMM